MTRTLRTVTIPGLALSVLLAVPASAVPAPVGDSTTTEEIVEMLEGGVSEDLIRLKIDTDGCLCSTSPELIASLREAGSSDELLFTVIALSAESQADNPVMTPTIIEMLDLGIPEEVIWHQVSAAGCICDTSARAIIDLKRSGASDELVGMLIEVSAGREAAGEPERP